MAARRISTRRFSVESVLDAHLDHQISAGKRPDDAREWVDQGLRACLPPGVPPSYSSIVSAKYISSQPRHEALADVIMFDGLPAKVRVWLYARNSWAHEWTEMTGGACCFENGCWVRVEDADR